MQIDGRPPEARVEKSCLLLALEPPGNIARNLIAFKREFFSELGETAGLFLPEVAPLVFVRRRSKTDYSRSVLNRALCEVWMGIEGAFLSGAVAVSRGLLYLELEGPYENLVAATREACEKLSLAPFEGAPCEAGRGFFLGSFSGSDLERGLLSSPPRIAFRDCSLVLLGLRFGEDPLNASTWCELSRAKRRSGPSPTPSKRRKHSPDIDA
jgi:hypothetical protein